MFQLVIAYGVSLAFNTWHVQDVYNESKLLGFFIYNLFFTALVVGALYGVLGSTNPSVSYLLNSGMILWNVVVIVIGFGWNKYGVSSTIQYHTILL